VLNVTRANISSSSFFRGDDAGDAGEVVSDADVGPRWRFEKRLHGGQGIVAEFEDQNAAGHQLMRRLHDEAGVDFVAFFAAVERDFRFVAADFARQRFFFVAADVGRITHDEVEEE